MGYPNDDFLVETPWLAANLDDPNLRVIDCRINFMLDERGDVQFSSGEHDWASGHIPGAVHVNIKEELSLRESELPFMAPPAEQFAGVMSRLGVEHGNKVVLYDAFYNIWAARMWWLLRRFGFTDAAVLNGGLVKWKLENRPLATEMETVPSASFQVGDRQAVFVGKETVQSAIGDDETCIVDALYADHYSGENPAWVDRPGHIRSARNLPFNEIVDPDTHAYLPPGDLAEKLASLGLRENDRVITYCHAGNAASSVAFAMALMGHKNVAIYDGSLREWAADPSLPMEASP